MWFAPISKIVATDETIESNVNSNTIGDKQLGVPFDYDIIVKNMKGRKDSFNFLFIKKG